MNSRLTRRGMVKLAGVAALGVAGAMRTCPARAAVAGSYELIDIGETFPDASNPAWTGANDMTGDGVVVGNMWISDEKFSPWSYRDGKLSRIKTGKHGGLVSSVNDDGVISGREILGFHAPDSPWGRPVLWIDGEKQLLPYPDTLPDRAESGRAYNINNGGVVVGAVQIPGGASFPVVWRNGEPVVLPSLFESGQGKAELINDDGLIFGIVDDGAGGEVGVVWDGDAVSPLFSPPGLDGPVKAFGVDADGAVLGGGWTGEVFDAMVWPGQFDMPTVLPAAVTGQVQAGAFTGDGNGLIGGLIVVAEGDQRAVLWNDGQAIELGTLVENLDGAQLLVVRAFDADGRIAGSARFSDNTVHAVLLEPVG